MGENLAKKFGDAHECITNVPGHPAYIESIMDLHNNSVGYQIYNDLKRDDGRHVPTYNIASEICAKLYNGNLKVLSVPSLPEASSVKSSTGCSCN